MTCGPSAKDRSRTVLRAGWTAGAVTGLGAGGTHWINLYIALALMLGGLVLFAALTAALPKEPS